MENNIVTKVIPIPTFQEVLANLKFYRMAGLVADYCPRGGDSPEGCEPMTHHIALTGPVAILEATLRLTEVRYGR